MLRKAWRWDRVTEQSGKGLVGKYILCDRNSSLTKRVAYNLIGLLPFFPAHLFPSADACPSGSTELLLFHAEAQPAAVLH